MESRRECRKSVRRLLWRWAQVNEQCKKWQKEIEDKREVINAVTDIKSPTYSDIPHGSGISDRTALAAMKLESLEKQYEEFIAKVTEDIAKELHLQLVVDNAVRSLSRSQKSIIEYRYKSGYTYEQIAIKLSYNVDHVRRLEWKACDKLSERLPQYVEKQLLQ